MIGGGCTLLKLAAKVDAIKETLPNDEQKVGAEIVKKVRARARRAACTVHAVQLYTVDYRTFVMR